ncbi:MAG: ATP synthase F1 subunit gamma [Candidatus Doudnabacteria bacterium]
MASNSREIKRRIKSITNIGQITKAMELVSAAKMRKAQILATASRPYAILSSKLLSNISAFTDTGKHPLLNRPLSKPQAAPKRILAIVISSDRGLAGAFNTNVINKTVNLMKEEGSEKFDFITVGKKAADAVRRLNLNIIASFSAKDKVNSLDARPISQIAMQEYLGVNPAVGGSASGGKYEKVLLIYSDFVSTLVQKPNMLQLLPFANERSALSAQRAEFLFEPDADQVLESLITKTIEFTVYQALVEASASEHSARMVAMRNANEAAGDLLEDLSLSYNQARQAGITRELSEISAAKLAMES